MTYPVDEIYFQELAGRNSGDVRRRSGSKYDALKRCYTLSVWGDAYAIFPRESRIDRVGRKDRRPHDYFYLFIVYYLLKAKNIEIEGTWISEKDIPGGATFFRGPHEIPTRMICSRFGNDQIPTGLFLK